MNRNASLKPATYLALFLGVTLATAWGQENPAGGGKAAAEHPIKKLALAEADAEIAFKSTVEPLKEDVWRSFQPATQKVWEDFQDAWRKAQEAEQRKTEGRDEAFLKRCADVWNECNRKWNEWQQKQNQTMTVYYALQNRQRSLWDAVQRVRAVGDKWKELDLDLAPLAGMYGACTRELGKIAKDAQDAQQRLRDDAGRWQAELEQTRKDLLGQVGPGPNNP